MKIGLKCDVSGLEGRVRNAPKRITYAVVNAINTTLKLAQRALQLEAEDVLTIRKPDFIRRQIAIIKPFASVGQGRVFGEIAVGQKPRLLLAPLSDKGGDRPAFKGKNVAVPVGARPSRGASVPEELWISKLGFRRQPARRHKAGERLRSTGGVGKKRGWIGKLGTYLVPEVGIFQRIGHVARMLYVFVKRVRLRPMIRWVAIVRGVADRNFARVLRSEIAKALAHQGRR